MTKGVGNFFKGVGLGMVAGGVAGAVGYNFVRQNKRSVKKKIGKALQNASDLVENVGNLF